MPYTKDNYPEQIKVLPEGARSIWIRVFNAVYQETDGDEEQAIFAAWSAVKKAGYGKRGDKWVKLSLPYGFQIEGVPPKGISGLPSAMREQVPDPYKFWNYPDLEERILVRNELLDSVMEGKVEVELEVIEE